MRLILVLLVCVATATSSSGAGTDADASRICSTCHHSQLPVNGGHAPGIACVTCHTLKRANFYGSRHRSIPSDCTSHHTTDPQIHPAPTKELSTAGLRRRCLKCHDPHDSSNARLIRPALRISGQLHPISFPPPDGAGAFVDPTNPGHGLCEVCHRNTRFYRADGTGGEHFTGDCTACHDHAAAFEPVATDSNCATCHAAEAELFAGPSLHHDRFAGACSSCHAEVARTPGPGHRATAACVTCHSPRLFETHAPGVNIPCTGCHEPHGTGNRDLILDAVRTVPGGQDRSVQFDSLAGQADGSFASASQPGTGLCEICHTSTQFYRGDATGAAHYTTTCTTCHPHAAGFFPQ